MHIIWFAHIKDEKEKKEFKEYIENSTALLNRLTDILKNKSNAAESLRLSEKDFHMSSWPYRQADLNGYLRALKEMKEIVARKE